MKKCNFVIKELGLEFVGEKFEYGEVYSRLNMINNNKVSDVKLKNTINKYKIISEDNPSYKWIVRYEILGVLIWIPVRTQKDAIKIAKEGLNMVRIYDSLTENEKNLLFSFIKNKKTRLEAENSDIGEEGFFEKYFGGNEMARNLLVSKINI